MIIPGIKMKYTNAQGEVSTHEIMPVGLIPFRETEGRRKAQWIMRAWDHGKEDYQDFDLQDCDFTVAQGDEKDAACICRSIEENDE